MKTLALCLANEANEYQKAVCEDALATANRLGIKLEIYFANDKITEQIKQIYGCLHRDAFSRPAALLIMPVRVGALHRVAHDVLRAGIGWICLNRQIDDFENFRQAYRHLPTCLVSPDQREIGHIQGRQFCALLPDGGHLLYVQGEATNPSAQGRIEGLREVIQGTKIELAGTLDGNWSTQDAERVISSWLRIALLGNSQIDLIGCQNDAMAIGALKALQSVAAYLGQPEIAKIPVTGCDGVVHVGQKLVREGELAATVIIPSTGGPAVELIATAWSMDKPLPPQITLSSLSYPPETTLAEPARSHK
ncbi:MAG: sugar ABC transporter substrate-binding protein [Acidobacteriota bacterium]